MLALPAVPASSRHDGAVVVCGAGAAGLAAALSAARHQARVLLIEASAQLGGTVASALIHTLAGLYDSAGELINRGLPAELEERLLRAHRSARRRNMGRVWVLNVCPLAYRDVVTRWIADQPSIRVLLGAQVTHAVQLDQRINELQILHKGRTVCIRPAAVIDTTGTAEVARLLDKSHVIDDERRAAGGWIFRLRGIAHGALDFPKGIGVVRALRAAAQSGVLPSECAHAWLDAGVYPDEAFVKLMAPLVGDLRDPESVRRAASQAQANQALVVKFLRQLSDFSDAEVTQAGTLGVRDGGRIRGRYTLTVDDVRQGSTFPDAVCRCAWPIEYWDPERGVSIEHLRTGAHYEIPMRCLQLNGVQNLWAAGKCLSADRQAHASARVVGACWAMGEAAGAAAANHENDNGEHCGDSELVQSVPRDRATAAR